MSENIKRDYLIFVLHKARADLTKFNIKRSDEQLIARLMSRLIRSENLLKELYILSHISEFRNLGKYITFILKKIEDNVINFDNLSENITADTEFIEGEFLKYLSRPEQKERFYKQETEIFQEEEEETDNESEYEVKENYDGETDTPVEEFLKSNNEKEEKEISSFKKNYLELIQSETGNEDEIVYELPEENISIRRDIEPVNLDETYAPGEQQDGIHTEQPEQEDADVQLKQEENQPDISSDEIIFEDTQQQSENEELVTDENENEVKQSGLFVEDERIQLSEEIQDEINSAEENEGEYVEDVLEEHVSLDENAASEPEPNSAFIEYENTIIESNRELDLQFDNMIQLLAVKPAEENERISTINKIIELSSNLEKISREISLEIISNIYQTISLSFVKISDGKYDISESTINLFKHSLLLVMNLIKGEDYYEYKEVLKSVENIRNLLIEENLKREKYRKQKEEMIELQKKMTRKYPEDSQRTKAALIKQHIKDSEEKFRELDSISGEYHIYEALRSLSGNLNSFKEIVKLSRELKMEKLLKLSEAAYIFVKFLQNYRINPVTIETKEIFGYIIYNMKALMLEKPIEDVDVFISYLNDPVKIFSVTAKTKKSEKQ